MDPTGHDPLLRWLAYAHPALMLVALSLAGVALRRGLAMRRLRLAGARGRGALLRPHLAVARPAIALIAIGVVSGPASAYWLRGWEPLGTFHGWIGLLAAILFGATGVWGRRLRTGRTRAVDGHGLVAGLAALAAAVAAVAGFVLLP